MPEFLIVFGICAGSFPAYVSDIVVLALGIHALSTVRKAVPEQRGRFQLVRDVGLSLLGVSILLSIILIPAFQSYPKITAELLFCLCISVFSRSSLIVGGLVRGLSLTLSVCALIMQHQSIVALRELGLSELLDFKLTLSTFAWGTWPSSSNLLLLCVWYICLLVHRSRQPAWFSLNKVVYAITSILLLSVLLLTFSRSVYYAIVVSAVATTFGVLAMLTTGSSKNVAWKTIGTPFFMTTAIFVGAMVVSVTIAGSRDAFIKTLMINKTSSQRRSALGRISVYKDSLKIQSKPIFGSGIGSFPIAIDLVRSAKPLSLPVSQAFSSFLEIYLEQGLFGLVGLTLILVSALWGTYSRFLSSELWNDLGYRLPLTMSSIAIPIYIAFNAALFSSIGNSIFTGALLGSCMYRSSETKCVTG